MRVALVHDWLVTYRGGEKVLEALCELYPSARVYTLLHAPGSMPEAIERMPIRASVLDRLPGARAFHRHLLPLYPLAIEQLRLEPCDLVLSSSHCVAKGVQVPRDARHLAYVHAPMRYMWDRFDDYFGPGRARPAVRAAAHLVRPALQRWDVRSARRVDRFVANSRYIAGRVEALYGRRAAVVHPPVELERFTAPPLPQKPGEYFLWFGALAPYKRVDLAVEAFQRLGLPLWIGGSGQDAHRLRSGLPPNIRYLGQVPDADLPGLYQRARALVFTGEEDFGLTPLEAQASGRPVIAYRAGGALETVTPRTGLFFDTQTVGALEAAVRQFCAREEAFAPGEARAHAQGFSKAAFQAAIQEEVETLLHPP